MSRKKTTIKWPSAWRSSERAAFERGVVRLGIERQKALPRVIKAYGQWLSWAAANRLARRPSEASLRRFFEIEIVDHYKPLSGATMLMWVKKACVLLYPDDDWRWLSSWCASLWSLHAPQYRRAAGSSPPPKDYVPFSEWPVADRVAWERTMARAGEPRLQRYGRARNGEVAGLVANGKRPETWADETKERRIRNYGRLLAFQRRAKLGNAITPTCIVKWVKDMDDRGLSSTTSVVRVEDVHALVSRVFAPQEDWSWLAHDLRLLRMDMKPKRDKSQKLVNLECVWSAAWELIDRAERNPNLLRSALEYQAGLMLGILVYHPVRLKNFCEMRMGVHVIADPDGKPLRLRFPRTKTAYKMWDFADELVPLFLRYWSWFRTLLRGAANNTAVWPAPAGGCIQPRSVRKHLARATKSTSLAVALNPHIIRDIVATALHNDGKPEAARLLLGHQTLKALRPYINSADSRAATRNLRYKLDEICARERVPRSKR